MHSWNKDSGDSRVNKNEEANLLMSCSGAWIRCKEGIGTKVSDKLRRSDFGPKWTEYGLRNKC